jgi:hypothetical protein
MIDFRRRRTAQYGKRIRNPHFRLGSCMMLQKNSSGVSPVALARAIVLKAAPTPSPADARSFAPSSDRLPVARHRGHSPSQRPRSASKMKIENLNFKSAMLLRMPRRWTAGQLVLADARPILALDLHQLD